MKVGIMSMQRIPNYGSFLQAYALKKIISGLGHDVEFVDYLPGAPVYPDSTLSKTEYLSAPTLKLKLLLKKLTGREIYFSERYQTMLKPLGISSEMRFKTPVDTLVIGSDEVFNCLQSNPDVGFSPDLFGKDANAKRVISYGASFGFTTEDSLKKAGRYDEVKGYIHKFDALSLRDENSADIVKGMGVENFEMHLDPVLIYGYEKEPVAQKGLSDYILVYSYAGRMSAGEEVRKIREFAKKHGKKIVTVGFHQPWSDIKLEADPFELLGYFKNADFVVTDTFHGTIFSIITNRRFATVVRESNKQKLSSLLGGLELEHRIVQDISKLEDYILPPVDYEKTKNIINEQRKKSIEYLKKNI